jgi:cation diffusion facilitator CzcD-associated flavoprotein CzcO
MHSPAAQTRTHSTGIIIIGAGFSGIGLAIQLRKRGIDDFVILERAAAAGGTWRDNSYPGCACDVQSSLYSFSFAPNPDWSRTFSQQPEIWAYLQRCVGEYDIERHIQYAQNVTGATWDDVSKEWSVTTTGDTWRGSALVMANGPLSEPVRPAISGLDAFAGTMFHSSQWDHSCDLRGKRVAVIGTGASAIQFVPCIQPHVAHLDLFQRTPPWVLPRNDAAVPAWRRRLYRTAPIMQRIERGAMYLLRELLHVPFRHRFAARTVEWYARYSLRRQVPDASLRAKLTPTYQIGCKRILISDDYYPAIQQPNVSLITDAIASVTPDGVMMRSGTLLPADVIVLGTGFRATDPPLAPFIIGRDGLSLASRWRGSPHAYMGTTHAGFPNLFTLLGPNTALGHSSVMLMVEAQITHLIGVWQLMQQQQAASAEPDAAAQAAYCERLDARLARTTWNRGGCQSWYLDRTGRNSTLWPDGVGRFVRTVSHVIADDYLFAARPVSARVDTARA